MAKKSIEFLGKSKSKWWQKRRSYGTRTAVNILLVPIVFHFFSFMIQPSKWRKHTTVK